MLFRSTEGLTLLHDLFLAQDDEDLRSVVTQTRADLVLYCPTRDPAEAYWRSDQPRPLPSWMTLLAGDRTGSAPVLLRVSREIASRE